MADRSTKRKLSMSSSADRKLPQDLVFLEILKRLPVESLLRFRCVCRSWRSAIDDPRFVAIHLNHSALDASNWYLVCLDWRDLLRTPCSLFSNESLALPSQSEIEIPFVTPHNRYDFVGSCNGLICVAEFSRNGQTMYLWNLFTRKHKAVPRSGPEHQFLSVEPAHFVQGFGFDARSNDYKIVRIVYFPANHRRCFSGTKSRLEIYSLRTDTWRSLECEVPFCGYRPAVFLNGNLHWSASKFGDVREHGRRESMVSFDVAGEVFDEMALPGEIFDVGNGDLTVSVAVLNDLLAVLFNLMDAVVHHSICSVWVMREYGVPESWTKLYTFKDCAIVTRFDGFTRNGMLLMEIFPGKRVARNPVTGEYTKLPVSKSCNLVTVVESLVHFRNDSIAATFTGNAD